MIQLAAPGTATTSAGAGSSGAIRLNSMSLPGEEKTNASNSPAKRHRAFRFIVRVQSENSTAGALQLLSQHFQTGLRHLQVRFGRPTTEGGNQVSGLPLLDQTTLPSRFANRFELPTLGATGYSKAYVALTFAQLAEALHRPAVVITSEWSERERRSRYRNC